MDNSGGSIYDIVGSRERCPVGWAPGYGAVYRPSSVGWMRCLVASTIGLGAGLLVGIWMRWRRNHE